MTLDVRKADRAGTTNDKAKIRRELREGYLRENETNHQLAEEWFLLDEKAWETAESETRKRLS